MSGDGRASVRPLAVSARKTYLHPTSDVSPGATLGPGTQVWNWSQIREGAVVGADTVVGQQTYIGVNARVGDRCRIMSKAIIDTGVEIGNDVFVGPSVIFTNDNAPRAWSTRDLSGIRWVVEDAVSIGANVVVLPDVSIGHHALVGAMSFVTRNVPPHALVMGKAARVVGWVCKDAHPMTLDAELADGDLYACPETGEQTKILKEWATGRWQPTWPR